MLNKTLTVQPDQDEGSNEQEGTTNTKILRWNFPTFGSMYLDIIRNFINISDSEKLYRFVKRNLALLAFGLKACLLHIITEH